MDHDPMICELCLRWEAFQTGSRWAKHDVFVAELDRLEKDLEDLTKELDQKRRRREHLVGMVSEGPPSRFRLPSYPLPPEIDEAKRHHEELLTGSSVDPVPADGGHHHAAAPDRDDPANDDLTAIDPVCGMTVQRTTAVDKGLQSHHAGADYYFCGKGCKLDFDEGPDRFLDPGYIPAM